MARTSSSSRNQRSLASFDTIFTLEGKEAFPLWLRTNAKQSDVAGWRAVFDAIDERLTASVGERTPATNKGRSCTRAHQYFFPCGRMVTAAVLRIFRTVVRPSANSSATCRLVCPNSYASTTSARRRAVIRRRFGRGETNRDGRSVTSASSCTFVNNMFGLNRIRATTVPATT